jgi:hypothetical protein
VFQPVAYWALFKLLLSVKFVIYYKLGFVLTSGIQSNRKITICCAQIMYLRNCCVIVVLPNLIRQLMRAIIDQPGGYSFLLHASNWKSNMWAWFTPFYFFFNFSFMLCRPQSTQIAQNVHRQQSKRNNLTQTGVTELSKGKILVLLGLQLRQADMVINT